MKGRTHLAVGLGIGIVGSFNQSPEYIPIILAASGVSSLAPDLDGNNLLNKFVTKTAKQLKKWGFIGGLTLIILSLFILVSDENSLPFLNRYWVDQQRLLILLGVGIIILGISIKKQELLKNILMSLIGIALLYYGSIHDIWWLVMFALYIGGAGWFSHRGFTHTVWALIYWAAMSYLLEQSVEIGGLALILTLSYFSHIAGDMLTKRGVKFFKPVSNKVFRVRL